MGMLECSAHSFECLHVHHRRALAHHDRPVPTDTTGAQELQEDPGEEELPDAAKASSQGGMGLGWGGGVDVGDALRGLQGGLLAECCKPCVFFDALW